MKVTFVVFQRGTKLEMENLKNQMLQKFKMGINDGTLHVPRVKIRPHLDYYVLEAWYEENNIICLDHIVINNLLGHELIGPIFVSINDDDLRLLGEGKQTIVQGLKTYNGQEEGIGGNPHDYKGVIFIPETDERKLESLIENIRRGSFALAFNTDPHFGPGYEIVRDQSGKVIGVNLMMYTMTIPTRIKFWNNIQPSQSFSGVLTVFGKDRTFQPVNIFISSEFLSSQNLNLQTEEGTGGGDDILYTGTIFIPERNEVNISNLIKNITFGRFKAAFNQKPFVNPTHLISRDETGDIIGLLVRVTESTYPEQIRIQNDVNPSQTLDATLSVHRIRGSFQPIPLKISPGMSTTKLILRQ